MKWQFWKIVVGIGIVVGGIGGWFFWNRKGLGEGVSSSLTNQSVKTELIHNLKNGSLVEKEGIVIPTVKKWKIAYQFQKGWALYYELIPPDQNLGNYSKMVTLVIGKGKRVNPARFIDRWAKMWSSRECPGGKVFLIGDNLTAPTPWSEVRGVCPDGREVFAKGIKGKLGFYFVTFELKNGKKKKEKGKDLTNRKSDFTSKEANLEGLIFIHNLHLKERKHHTSN